MEGVPSMKGICSPADELGVNCGKGYETNQQIDNAQYRGGVLPAFLSGSNEAHQVFNDEEY